MLFKLLLSCWTNALFIQGFSAEEFWKKMLPFNSCISVARPWNKWCVWMYVRMSVCVYVCMCVYIVATRWHVCLKIYCWQHIVASEYDSWQYIYKQKTPILLDGNIYTLILLAYPIGWKYIYTYQTYLVPSPCNDARVQGVKKWYVRVYTGVVCVYAYMTWYSYVCIPGCVYVCIHEVVCTCVYISQLLIRCACSMSWVDGRLRCRVLQCVEDPDLQILLNLWCYIHVCEWISLYTASCRQNGTKS